jgi:hypothetical protein
MIPYSSARRANPHIDAVHPLGAKAAGDWTFAAIMACRGITSIGSLKALSHHELRRVQSGRDATLVNMLIKVTE